MDPITVGIVVGALASSAAAALGWRGRARRAASAATSGQSKRDAAALAVGRVVSHLGDEFWLAGALTLAREGSDALRLFSAPQRGTDRWVALPRTDASIWFLAADATLATMGAPGIEVALGGRLFRRVEFGAATIASTGEGVGGWDGPCRYWILRARDAIAVVVEGPGAQRLALVGTEVPRELVEIMG